MHIHFNDLAHGNALTHAHKHKLKNNTHSDTLTHTHAHTSAHFFRVWRPWRVSQMSALTVTPQGILGNERDEWKHIGESAFCRRERERCEYKPKSIRWRWRRGRNNQFSDISKCALDDAYLNRPEMVRRERGREWRRWTRKSGRRRGVWRKVRDYINEEKLGGKEIKEELSWRDCYIRPFGP